MAVSTWAMMRASKAAENSFSKVLFSLKAPTQPDRQSMVSTKPRVKNTSIGSVPMLPIFS
ncbi:hypothetical protein EYF80_060342 [Liparis tanakae]|uniref:Uncharacterized protein n=1 Tax=Liparis tanakae TaxID=230148 RepID=A0A4Z2EL29_9TELE|nr:hypothetical protein EYF80_060342 [Liparis tanakae]